MWPFRLKSASLISRLVHAAQLCFMRSRFSPLLCTFGLVPVASPTHASPNDRRAFAPRTPQTSVPHSDGLCGDWHGSFCSIVLCSACRARKRRPAAEAMHISAGARGEQREQSCACASLCLERPLVAGSSGGQPSRARRRCSTAGRVGRRSHSQRIARSACSDDARRCHSAARNPPTWALPATSPPPAHGLSARKGACLLVHPAC